MGSEPLPFNANLRTSAISFSVLETPRAWDAHAAKCRDYTFDDTPSMRPQGRATRRYRFELWSQIRAPRAAPESRCRDRRWSRSAAPCRRDGYGRPERSTPSGTKPIPVVLMKIRRLSLFDDLGIAGDDVHPASRGTTQRMTTRRSSSIEKPSSIMKAALKNSGVAPPIAKSLIVPWTAREPMSPPEKNNGLTTKNRW